MLQELLKVVCCRDLSNVGILVALQSGNSLKRIILLAWPRDCFHGNKHTYAPHSFV